MRSAIQSNVQDRGSFGPLLPSTFLQPRRWYFTLQLVPLRLGVLIPVPCWKKKANSTRTTCRNHMHDIDLHNDGSERNLPGIIEINELKHGSFKIRAISSKGEKTTASRNKEQKNNNPVCSFNSYMRSRHQSRETAMCILMGYGPTGGYKGSASFHQFPFKRPKGTNTPRNAGSVPQRGMKIPVLQQYAIQQEFCKLLTR